MTLPPSDHACWKLAQGIVSVIGLTILVLHGVDGGHTSAGLDVQDASGAVGLGAGGLLVRNLLKGLS